jgi:SAM-dependent methyltransferase
MERLRAMRPYEFLAYIGDPDAAPGGSAAVARATRLLVDCGVAPDSNILDVGCFTGLSTFTLADTFPHTLGIDINPVFAAAASRLGEILGSSAQFAVLDGASTGLSSESFDVVMMTATLGYTSNPEALIAEARRILGPGGLFVEFFYHHRVRDEKTQRSVRAAIGPDVQLRSLSDQVEQVERHGFQLVTAIRVPTSAAEGSFESIRTTLKGWEHTRNPDLSAAELDEFSDMVRAYLGRTVHGQLDSTAYLCVFQTSIDEGGYD